MTEKIRLSIIHKNCEYASELTSECISLTEETYAWLKDAFVAVGFDSDQVKMFFSDLNARKPDENN